MNVKSLRCITLGGKDAPVTMQPCQKSKLDFQKLACYQRNKKARIFWTFFTSFLAEDQAGVGVSGYNRGQFWKAHQNDSKVNVCKLTDYKGERTRLSKNVDNTITFTRNYKIL